MCGVCAAYRMHASIAARIVRIKATTACNRDRSSIYGHGTQGIITNIHYRPLGGVSHVDVRPPDASITDAVDVEGLGRIGIQWSPARGKKCGRCWMYRDEVSEDGDLCDRCRKVVDELAPTEMPTA